MKPTKFKLPFKSFRKELSHVLDSKAVVVSVFGKSPYNLASCKVGLIDNFLGQNVFKPTVLDEPEVDPETLCEIEGYYDRKLNVLYLHLCGIFDTQILVKQCQQLSVDLEEKGYLSVWAQLKHGYARCLLFLFSVSHVLVITHPSQSFDISYIHLFRALDNVRLKLQTCISETLGKISGVHSDWSYNARLCSPRVLFLFQASPSIFRKKHADGRNVNIKKLEHALEDQIYHILRKSRIITNISSNSLFAIPANQEFVFVQTEQDATHDLIPFLVNSLVDLCKNNSSAEHNHCSFGYESLESYGESKNSSSDHSFQKFLQQHIDQALLRGFDDNVGRHLPSNTYFVVPTVGVWMEVSNALYHLIITNGLMEKCSSANAVLNNLLDTDVKFSEARCSKVLPLAIATYQENLPSHYTKEYHEGKVAHALSIFGVHARGPLVENYVTQLEHDCERHWKSGRQMCEVLSLTGNPCTKPLHKGGSGEPSIHEADNINKGDLPVMEHCSGVRYISACDCGRKQGSREDPFTVRTANYDFYQILGAECGCDVLDRIHFPVFQPSTKDYKAAQLFSHSSLAGSSRKDSNTVSAKDLSNQHGNTQGLSLAYVSVHSGGGESDLLIGDTHLNADTATVHPRICGTSLTENEHHIVIQVSDADVDSSKEKCLVRQPSTTEYLPGMLQMESPSSLLPQFPSWSLVCLGPSSLYSHNLGLQEQQQAGLLIGSAYLLPWDVTVRLEQQQKDKFWPTVGDPNRNKQSQNLGLSKGRKSKSTKDLSEFNVKIFVGVEYECPRGHRFMCSAPDKMLKTSGTGLVKDNGNKVTGCDMPLYFPCPCTNNKPLIAQLMRVHVVTPKAPVHVTLNPKVQPAPNPCPVFVTGCQEPMRLSQSAYWVLRLPYVYVGDRGPYLPPKDPVPSDYGRLLAGMYGIVEISDNKL